MFIVGLSISVYNLFLEKFKINLMKKTVYQFFRMSFLMVFLSAFTLNAQTGYLYFPDNEVAADIITVATEVVDPSTADVDLTGDFTVQVSGTADTEIVLSNGIIFYAYTPVVTGDVRIVKKGTTVYVFEGSESKGTISSQDHDIYTEITDVDAHDNAAQLLTNASFETTGGLVDGSTANYKFGEPWVTNVEIPASVGTRLATSVEAVNGAYVVIWRGSGNSNYFAQPVTGLKANTMYQVIVRQIAGANANANFMVGLGSSADGLEHISSLVRLGNGYNGTQTATVMTPTDMSGEVYFTFKNTPTNTASSGNDPLTQIDYVALVEGVAGQPGIAGASGSVYYAAGVYAPEQSLNFAAGDYYDMTNYIVNPSFEVGGFNGWTNSGMQTQTNDPSAQGWTKDGNVYVERWTGAPNALPASSVTQTVTGLPNGVYKLLAAGHAVMQNAAEPTDTEGAFLFAGTDQMPLNVGGEYVVADVLVVGGSLSIGFKLEGAITANWAAVDNFRLQYFGVDLSSLNDLLTEKVAEAQAILDATGNPAGYNKVELETAIANAAVVEQNEASFEAAINGLEAGIANFNEVVAAYGELKAALDFAATLDATNFPGKSAFDDAVVVAQGIYDSTDDKTVQDFTDAAVVLKAAVQTYVLSQAAPANITSLLANPGFDVEPITFTETNGTANGTALVATRIYDIPGWNENLVSDWGRIATTSYGITFDPIPDVLNGTTPPATDMSGNTEGAALKLSGSWGSPSVVTQNVTLPAGNYELSFEVINMSPGQSIGVNRFGFVPNAGDAVFGTKTLFEGEWTNETVAFSLDAETAGKLSVGFVGVDAGAGSNGKLYIDNVNLIYFGDVVTVTFNTNGGSAIESQMVEKGSVVIMPEVPTMAGNIFTGWYSDVDLTLVWDFETTITEDLTLFAGWRVPSDVAELSNLTVNGIDVDGFAANTYSYDVVFPAGTVDVPTVTATSLDDNATVEILVAEQLPGTTTVTVTAEDGTTELSYMLNFTVDLASSLNVIGMGNIQVYPTVSNGRFTVDTNGQECRLTVIDMTGRIISVYDAIINKAVSIDKPGIYLLKVERNGVSKVFKVVKRN